MRYKTRGSNYAWILQLPVCQQLAYFSIFLELSIIDMSDKKILTSNQELTEKIVNSPKKIYSEASKQIYVIQKSAILNGYAKRSHKLSKMRIILLTEFLQMKLYEAFLEAAPQAILQVMIVFRRGFSDPIDIFTITTSLLSLTMCATDLFWKFPTQVSDS